jgi:hypothetical protein
MSECTAKFSATFVVWSAVASICNFGVFRSEIDAFLAFLCVTMLSGTAAGSTTAIWQRSKVALEARKKESVRELALHCDPADPPARRATALGRYASGPKAQAAVSASSNREASTGKDAVRRSKMWRRQAALTAQTRLRSR